MYVCVCVTIIMNYSFITIAQYTMYHHMAFLMRLSDLVLFGLVFLWFFSFVSVFFFFFFFFLHHMNWMQLKLLFIF